MLDAQKPLSSSCIFLGAREREEDRSEKTARIAVAIMRSFFAPHRFWISDESRRLIDARRKYERYRFCSEDLLKFFVS